MRTCGLGPGDDEKNLDRRAGFDLRWCRGSPKLANGADSVYRDEVSHVPLGQKSRPSAATDFMSAAPAARPNG